ncbi:MAG TPA: twin-arginine translocase TatA/TatE family subunit [Candidatus Binataceae bacterium]
MGIVEIVLFLVIALIIIPPDDLPQVMRTVGKVMRELRLASNTVMREISGAIGDDSPFNILPPRFDDPHPPTPSAAPAPPAPAFLAPEPGSEAPVGGAPGAEPQPPADNQGTMTRTSAEAQAPGEQPSSAEPTLPKAPGPESPDDKL